MKIYYLLDNNSKKWLSCLCLNQKLYHWVSRIAQNFFYPNNQSLYFFCRYKLNDFPNSLTFLIIRFSFNRFLFNYAISYTSVGWVVGKLLQSYFHVNVNCFKSYNRGVYYIPINYTLFQFREISVNLAGGFVNSSWLLRWFITINRLKKWKGIFVNHL